MSGARPQFEDQVASVFAEALDLSPEQREDFLGQACRGDHRLQQRVQTLLDALPNAEEYFGSIHQRDTMDDMATPAMPAETGRQGQVLGHYRLRELLGKGGMGEVYRAEDLVLGRPAAVKLLLPGVDRQLRKRLLKESSASARIEHPAVATFYEHGHAEGLDYLAMEYVPGDTLRNKLKQGGLSPDQALSLVLALLDGLVHAHAKGIIHRDIKPENIMVTATGALKLLDFGIAKEIRLPDDQREALRTAAMLTGLTGHGFIVGTLGYMSPEQLRGEVVSEQTDLFAVGAVLYEMLAGEPAFPGIIPSQRMAATLSRELPLLDLPGVHSDINAVLRRALARDCGDRYPNAAAFLRDLRDMESGVGLAILPNTLAILDLVNLSGQQEDDWIGTGVAESLGADLRGLAGLEMVPRNKVLRVAAGHCPEEGHPDPVAVGLALGSRWVLSGTCQRLGPRIRLTVRFVEVATGRDLWVEKLDGQTDKIFDMQDRLARITAESLDLVLPEEKIRKQDLSVHELYAKGRKVLLTLQNTDIIFAKEQLEKAIAIDPDFAPALSGLAAIHAPNFWHASADPAMLDAAEEFARRAIASAPEFWESYVFLGYALWRKGRFEKAIGALEKATDLNPGDELALYYQGCLLLEEGRPQDAVVQFRKAYENEADSVYVLSGLGHAHTLLTNYPEAEWSFNRAINLVEGGDPYQRVGPQWLLSVCLFQQGRLDEAWDLCKELLETVEASAHAFRSLWRLGGMHLLAEIAMARDDGEAARVAINQAHAMLKAQPAGPSKGHTMVQILALRSMIEGDREDFEKAEILERDREGFNFSWSPRNYDGHTCFILARAAHHHGEKERSEAYLGRARKTGCRLPFDPSG